MILNNAVKTLLEMIEEATGKVNKEGPKEGEKSFICCQQILRNENFIHSVNQSSSKIQLYFFKMEDHKQFMAVIVHKPCKDLNSAKCHFSIFGEK
ncbi:hypothetical protein ABK040_012507 [Willaertia magna]